MEKQVKVPGELLERAEALVAPVKAATLGAARWSQTAVVRLALDWGLSYLEELIERGAPLAPPKVPGNRKVATSGADTVRIQYRDSEESGGVAVSQAARTPKTATIKRK